MKRVALLFAAVAMTVLMSARSVEAQIRFGLAGGVSVPQSDAGTAFESGFHGQVMLGFGMIALPFKLRADLSYHNFGAEDNGLLFDTDDELRIISGALNAIATMGGIGVKPYLTGGIGLYNSEFSGLESETDFGINGGIGLEFSLTRLSTFVEVRYVNVFVGDDASNRDIAIVPITFGIMF
jgi:opacity protein-like surface antigen